MAETWLTYGESGTYKTSNIGEAADYMYEKYGGITRLITGDSGFKPVQDQINRGVIQPWNIRASGMPITCVIFAGKGFWPSKWKDLEAGIADESSLVKNFDGVSMVSVEGLTMLSDLFLSDLVSKSVSTGQPLQGTDKGEANYTETLAKGQSMEFVGSSQGTYGFVQNRTFEYVTKFSGLPVKRVLFTGHEGKGEDKKTKTVVYGPATIGKSQQDKVSGWFANTLHYEGVNEKDAKGKVIPAVYSYFTRHPDSQVSSIQWPAKLSLTPRQTALLNKKHPDGRFKLNLDMESGVYKFGLYQFWEMLDGIV